MTASSSSSASPSLANESNNGESNESTMCSKVSASSDPWNISVKTVGGGIEVPNDTGTIDSSGERQFIVQVSPDDDLDCLYDQIETTTGLKASQQRLIYRGRLIGLQAASSADTGSPEAAAALSTNKQAEREDPVSREEKNQKVRDIAGLSDGHTIHLVKRRETETPSASSEENNLNGSSSGSNTRSRTSGPATDGDILNGSSSSGGGLLASLLGLSSTGDDGDSSNGGGGRQRWGLRGSRANGGSRSRRPHYRMTAEDRQVPDPGSLEPVRQGLMTLHTLLPHLQTNAGGNNTVSSPIESNREWYRGQWLDVLDTVNQWLEATVVEVFNPEDILPSHSSTPTADTNLITGRPRRRAPDLPCDPAVSGSDLEGRRRLLLEPCDSENDENDLGGELAGLRPRASNHGVQVLLVHYNGWPHRWDEWIRSDSERLRPFRTRTRHPNVSSTASPTPQSVFHESPRTNILPHGDDSEDRTALLPELARAVSAINDVLQHQVTAATGVAPTTLTSSNSQPMARTDSPLVAFDLPWISSSQENESEATPAEDLVEPSEGEETSNILRPADEKDYDADSENATDPAGRSLGPSNTIAPSLDRPQYNQRELQNLSTLLDRLGRTLTDAAPHVASLADNVGNSPQNEPEGMASVPEDDSYEEALEQALEEIAESMPESEESPADTRMGGLLSLWSRERRRQSQSSTNDSNMSNSRPLEETSSSTPATTPTTPSIDPDHEDYVSGLVNTTRGEVRSGPRSRSSNDDVTNLLGAYLASASLGGSGEGEDGGTGGGAGGLGQLLRSGSIGGGGDGGGGGIDIHIHAVVTSPGMPGGAVGITPLGGGGGATGGGTATGGTGLGGTRNLFSSTRRASSTNSILRQSRQGASSLLSSRRRVQSSEDDEDTGLFAELYSETPEPVDPSGSPAPGERNSARQASMSNLGSNRNGDSGDYVTGLRTSYGSSNFRREMESPSDLVTRINQNNSSMDHTNVGAVFMAGRSSTRRRSSRRSLRRETADDSSSSNASATPPRRASGWGRLFRRRSSREQH